MKSLDKGIPTPALPQKKGGNVNTVTVGAGLSSGQARAKRSGINPALPKK